MQSLNVNEVKDTFLECPVCTEHFNQTDRRPRLLHSCLHAFCTQCLQQLLNKEGKQQITCPLCRQVEPVRGKSDSLRVDPVRDKLTEYIQIKELKKVRCTDCPDGEYATSRCQECLCYLCTHCASAHKRNRLSRDHSVVSLDKVLEDPEANFNRSHLCPSHPKHHVEFFCDTDEQLCCVSCCIVDHKGHDLLKLEDAAASRIAKIETKLAIARQTADRAKEALRMGMKEKQWIQHVKLESIMNINEVFENLKEAIDVHRAMLLSQVEDGSRQALTKVENATSANEQSLAVIDSTEMYFRRSKQKADVVEMLQMYPSIMKNIENVKGETDVQHTSNEKFKFISHPLNTDSFLAQFGVVIGANSHRALKVQGLSEYISEITISLYFEKRRRSSGGDVHAIERLSCDTAILQFEDDESLQRVVNKEHEIHGQKLKVSITTLARP